MFFQATLLNQQNLLEELHLYFSKITENSENKWSERAILQFLQGIRGPWPTFKNEGIFCFLNK